MEEQYRMKEPMPKQQSRFMRIWGPVLIKWGIAFGVSMLAMMVFELVMFIKDSGLDLQSVKSLGQIQQELSNYMMSMMQSADMTTALMEEFLKYSTLIEGVAALVTIPVMLVMFHKDRVKEKLAGVVPVEKASAWKYAGVLVMSVALTLGVNNLIVIAGISAYDEGYEETMSALYSAPFLLQIVCLGILIPICEELVFRGLMFRRIRQTSGFLQAALYSSLVFGFLHMNIVQMLYGFCLGMVFCYFYEKYGSVKAPILGHMSANIFSVIMTEFAVMDWMAKAPLRIGIITVACATVASSMYVMIQKIQHKEQKTVKNS